MASKKTKELLFTPQQRLFLAYYCDPKSETYNKSTQSAIKAGYGREYAENITSLDLVWLKDGISELVGKDNLLKKARKNLEIGLEGGLDREGEAKRIQADLTKFTLKTLDKETFSERTELTGKDGDALSPVLVQFIDKPENDTSNN